MNRTLWSPHHRCQSPLRHDSSALDRFALSHGGTVPADYVALADHVLGFSPMPSTLRVGPTDYRINIAELLGFTTTQCALTTRLANMRAGGLADGVLPILDCEGSVIAYDFRVDPIAPHLVHIAAHEWSSHDYQPVDDSLTSLLDDSVAMHREDRTAVYLWAAFLDQDDVLAARLQNCFPDLEATLHVRYFYSPMADVSLWVAPIQDLQLSVLPPQMAPTDLLIEVLLPPDHNMQAVLARIREALSA